MTRRTRLLLALDVGLIAAAGYLGVQAYRIWTQGPGAPGVPTVIVSRGSMPMPRSMLASAVPPRIAAPPAPSRPEAGAGFDVVAEQNLFSPTRREAEPVIPNGRRPARRRRTSTAPSKPLLYGIVLGAPDGPRAYLKESQANKLLGYVIGDMVGRRVLEEIRADRVLLRESGGELVQVLLRDPSKPRPALTRPSVRASLAVRPTPRSPATRPRPPAP